MRTALILMALVPLAACRTGGSSQWQQLDPGTRDVLEEPDSAELITLVPFPPISDENPLGAGEEAFHDYKVISRTHVQDAAVTGELLDLIHRGVAASDGTVAACFNPRHGLRLHRGDDVVDLVICFECLSIDLYQADGTRQDLRTVDTVEPEVTRIYEAQGLVVDR